MLRNTPLAPRLLILATLALIALVAVVLISTLTQPAAAPSPPVYRTDNTPGAVADNYVTALIAGDFVNAYAQLSPSLPGYPASAADFETQFRASFSYDELPGANFTLTAPPPGDEIVAFTVTLNFPGQGGPFPGDPLTRTAQLRLIAENGQWRIIDGDDPLIPYCLANPSGCP